MDDHFRMYARPPGAEQAERRPILVAEDNPEQLELLGMLLHYEHYRVSLTADGRQALDWLAQRRPALVILDWHLPEVSGYHVAAATRERYGNEVPILVLSALATAAEALEAGAEAFLSKPYHMTELLDTIHRLLGT